MDTLDNIKTGGQQDQMLSEESRHNFTKICTEGWQKHLEIHNVNPAANGSFRGGQVKFTLQAIGHMKRSGEIVMWEIEGLEIVPKFKYDV